jgi:hypothetical protein
MSNYDDRESFLKHCIIHSVALTFLTTHLLHITPLQNICANLAYIRNTVVTSFSSVTLYFFAYLARQHSSILSLSEVSRRLRTGILGFDSDRKLRFFCSLVFGQHLATTQTLIQRVGGGGSCPKGKESRA